MTLQTVAGPASSGSPMLSGIGCAHLSPRSAIIEE
jgi:hypothetical protein